MGARAAKARAGQHFAEFSGDVIVTDQPFSLCAKELPAVDQDVLAMIGDKAAGGHEVGRDLRLARSAGPHCVHVGAGGHAGQVQDRIDCGGDSANDARTLRRPCDLGGGAHVQPGRSGHVSGEDLGATLHQHIRVFTSGEGGIFPKGIPIGQIVDVQPVDYGLRYEARVRLAANLNALEEVWVMFP